MNMYEKTLGQFTENDWFAAVENLAPQMHRVDRNAAQIWFRFYPLALHQYLADTEDREKTIRRFVMQGEFELKNQISSSHDFLYGHRFWNHIKTAIENRAGDFKDGNTNLKAEIESIAAEAAGKAGVDASLTLGIAAVGLMTLRQVGLEAFKNAGGETEKPKGLMAKSPDQIVRQRAEDDSQGIFGFLKTIDKTFTVHYDETINGGKFKLINNEEIATASARDQSKNWQAADERCLEGVIPVECRSAACGTCWVGVLGGEEKLSEVQELERNRMKIFGYRQPDDARPFLRLACQAKARGNVSLVIPPWNGVFGKKVYGVEEVQLEPATTSARKLRETIAEASETAK